MMMTKTQLIDAYKSIKKRFISFLSIALIVAFGIGGSYATVFLSKGTDKAINNYYDYYNFYDYEMISSLGIRDYDLEQIKQLDGIFDAEGGYSLNGELFNNNNLINVNILSIQKKINRLDIVSGDMPLNKNECTISPAINREFGLNIGDKIIIQARYGDKNPLKCEEFKITAIAYSPYYLSDVGVYIINLPYDSFNQEVINNIYTNAYIKIKSKDHNILENDEFDQKIKEDIWDLTYELQKDDLPYYKNLAYEKINAEEQKTNDALNEANKQIIDNEKELHKAINEARLQIKDSKEQLENGRQQLLSAEAQIKDGEAKLQEAKILIEKANTIFSVVDPSKANEILNKANDLVINIKNAIDSTNHEQIDNARKELKDFLNDQNVNDVLLKAEEISGLNIIKNLNKIADGTFIDNITNTINETINKINLYIQYKDSLPQYEKQIVDGKKEIEEGYKEYNKNLNLISENEKLINQKEAEGKKQIQEAKIEFENKKEEVLNQIKNAKEEVEKLDINIIVQDHSSNAGYVAILNYIGSIDSAGKIFGILFFIITSLVCFSTLSIIVEEDKKSVGTTKAFGFHNIEIVGKYLIFAIVASLIGAIFGILLAYGIAWVVSYTLDAAKSFSYGVAKINIDLIQSIIITIVYISLCSIVTIITCHSLLKSPASLLMKGETINSSKIKQKKHKNNNVGTLYSRLIIKNMLDDKSRVLITIVIVAVSVAIIGVGFTAKFAFNNTFTSQCNNIFKYDLKISYSDKVNDEEIKELEQILKDNNTNYLNATYEAHLFNKNKTSIDAINLIVADKELIGNFISIIDSKTNKEFILPDDGLIVQQKLDERGILKIDDEIRIIDNNLNYHDAKVVGSFYNHQGRIVLLSNKAYQNIFNQYPNNNCFFVILNEDNEELIRNKISSISKYISIEKPDHFIIQYASVQRLFDIVVIVLTGMAIIMSFMILTNLANIFITRKKKELIVMRINGFTIKETINYLAKETIITTIIGLLIGLILGAFLAKYGVYKMEPAELLFVRSYQPLAWALAFLIEASLAFIINFLAFRKVKNISFREL